MDSGPASGILQPTSRATRYLYPATEPETAELSEEEKARCAELRSQAGRKLKMARVLDAGDLAEEAREARLEALPLLGQSLAIEHGLPPPTRLPEAITGPLAPHWGESAPLLRLCLDFPETFDLASLLDLPIPLARA